MIFHIVRNLPAEFLLPFIQLIAVQKIIILVVQICDNLPDHLSGALIGILLYLGKAERNHRISTLQAAVFLFLPDGESLKQIFSVRIRHRKELLQHTHIQRLSETPRTSNQRHIILGLPPLFYKIRLIHVEIIVDPNLLKILPSDTDRSRHAWCPSLRLICNKVYLFSPLKSIISSGPEPVFNPVTNQCTSLQHRFITGSRKYMIAVGLLSR